MLVVISPAKKLDFNAHSLRLPASSPTFIAKTNKLAKELKKLTTSDIKKLMKLSDSLSELNYNRFQEFLEKPTKKLSKEAILAFNGDTYTGLDAQSFEESELLLSNKNLRILSGLYGILRPLDRIQPYRLEMGTGFNFLDYKNLYDYWSEDVTKSVNELLKDHLFLVNCASNEYFKVIKPKAIDCPIITPQFLDYKNDEFKMISFFAKKARGMMARYIILNEVKSLKQLLKFNLDGYKFNQDLTRNELNPVFTRVQ